MLEELDRLQLEVEDEQVLYEKVLHEVHDDMVEFE